MSVCKFAKQFVYLATCYVINRQLKPTAINNKLSFICPIGSTVTGPVAKECADLWPRELFLILIYFVHSVF